MNIPHAIPLPATRPASMLTLALASSLIFVLGACASAPVPTEKLAVAEAAVQRANTTSTSESAPGELQIALAKLASARQAVNDKDYERARQLAEQAEVDAQVAELRAQSTRSRKSAQESRDAARALSDEINRKSPR